MIKRIAPWLMLCLATLTSACNPETDPPQLEDGDAITGDVGQGCETTWVLGSLNKLCELFLSTGGCVNWTRSCNSYERQVFTGTRLSDASKPGNLPWNGMGGSGERMADAFMCTLKELSPELGGPLKTSITLNAGVGEVSATQEIGFLSWSRLNPVFKGYRKLRLNLPILGNIDAVTQDLTVTRKNYTYMRDEEFQGPLAGNRPILTASALNVKTQEKETKVNINPGGFDITTPIGVFRVEPSFDYEQRASVIDHPKMGSTYTDAHPWLGNDDRTVRLTNAYGRNPGVNLSSQVVTLNNRDMTQKGWMSQLAMGNRDPRSEPEIWKLDSGSGVPGPVERPDFGIETARSKDEGKPSLMVKASATVHYPENPEDLLPDWVNHLPYLKPPTAYIEITPSFRAAISDQFNLGIFEGAYHYEGSEFKLLHSRATFGSLWGGVSLATGFSIDVLMRMKIALDLPIWGEKVLVDITPKFPVKFPERRETNPFTPPIATSVTTDGNPQPQLDSLRTLQKNLVGKQATEAYFEECYSPKTEVAEQKAPDPQTEKGDPSKLFPEDQLWPCNICVYVDDIKSPEDDVDFEARGEYLLPSAENPSYLCNREIKTGCMDWCSWDRDTGKLHVVTPASSLATLVEGEDNTYPSAHTVPTVNPRYDGCAKP